MKTMVVRKDLEKIRNNEPVHCLLIQGKFSDNSFWNIKEVCEIMDRKYMSSPLSLITVAALLPQNWKFKLIDENIEDLKEDHWNWADLVCTGGMLPQQRRIKELIEQAHEHEIAIAVGGTDPTSQPHIYSEVDYLIIGEGEITIPMFLKDYLNGINYGTYVSKKFADMKTSPLPRFDLLNLNAYMMMEVQFSRGCPYTCEFCDIIELYGQKMRIKTIEQILAELQSLYELGFRGGIDIADDNLIGNRSEIKKILKAMVDWSRERNYPFYYSIQVSINIVKDTELLELFQSIDTRLVFVGIETAEDELIKAIEKKPNMNTSLHDAVHTLYDYGMLVTSGFIIGFDQETGKTADAVIKLIEETGICMAMIGLLYALPASKLTQRLRKEGRLFESSLTLKDNSFIDQTTSGLNFTTLRPRSEVLRDYLKVLRHVYSPENYFRKALYTASRIKLSGKYKLNFKESIVAYKAFVKLCLLLGTRSGTASHFWKLVFSVLFKTGGSLETAMDLSSMYLHFGKQAEFVQSLIEQKIYEIEEIGEKKYNIKMIKEKPITA